MAPPAPVGTPKSMQTHIHMLTHSQRDMYTYTHIHTLTHTLHSKMQIPGMFYIQSCVAEQVHNTWIDMQS